MKISLLIFLGLILCNGAAQAQQSKPQRIVALGGSVTEIIFALGEEDRLVGIDRSSIYPEQTRLLPSVGYYRSLPLEGLLNLKPDLVLASEQAGPEHVLEQLELMGIRVERVSDQAALESLYTRIEQIASHLEVVDHGRRMREKLEYQLNDSYRYPKDRQSVMMVVMRSGKLLGAGSNTAAAKIIELSRLENVLSDFNGYQPVSAEIVSARLPSALIVTRLSVEAMGGRASVRNHPALSRIPAVMNDQVIELDDLLAQGLGPRLPEAIEIIRRGVQGK